MADNPINSLRTSMENGNTDGFNAIIATNPDLTIWGDALLRTAVETQNLHFVTSLIAAGARARPDDDFLLVLVVLYVESQRDAIQMARLLIDAGAQVNTPPTEQPALFFAAERGRFEIFNYLIQQGANIDAVFAGHNIYDYIGESLNDEGRKNCAALILAIDPTKEYLTPYTYEVGAEETLVPRPEHFGDTEEGSARRIASPEIQQTLRILAAKRRLPAMGAWVRGHPPRAGAGGAGAGAAPEGGRRRRRNTKKITRRRRRRQHTRRGRKI